MTMLAVILMLLAVADVATIRAFLRAGVREANPLMRAGFERFGLWPLLLAAYIIQGSVVVWNLYLIWRSDRA